MTLPPPDTLFVKPPSSTASCSSSPPSPTPFQSSLPASPPHEFRTFLVLLGWLLNSTHCIIICTSCHSVVNPCKPAKHVSKCAPATKSVSEMKTVRTQIGQYQTTFDLLTNLPPQPRVPIDPIPGLEMHPNMQVCQTCKHGFGRDDNKHCKPKSG